MTPPRLHAVPDPEPDDDGQKAPRRKRYVRARKGGGRSYPVRYQEGGKTKQKTFHTVEERDAFRAELRRQKRLGIVSRADRTTTVEALAERVYNAGVAGGWSSAHAGAVLNALTCRILPWMGDRKIAHVDRLMVVDFVAWMTAAGDVRQCRNAEGKPYAAEELVPVDHEARRAAGPPTVKKTMAILGSVFEQAIAWDMLVANPTAKVQIPRVDEREGRILEPHEVLAIAERMPTERDRAIVLTSAFTGARSGELRALTWADVRLDKGREYPDGDIRLVRAAASDGGLKSVKNGSPRTTPLISFSRDALERWRLHAPSTQRDALVFPGDGGKMYSRSSWRDDVWLPALKGTDWVGLVFHDLRHTFVSLCAAAGIEQAEAMAMAGHKSAKAHARYRHLFARGARESAARLDEHAKKWSKPAE